MKIQADWSEYVPGQEFPDPKNQIIENAFLINLVTDTGEYLLTQSPITGDLVIVPIRGTIQIKSMKA